MIAITAVITTNFMDGLDGLVGAAWLCVGSCPLRSMHPGRCGSWSIPMGFLFWNWSPAKVFMGDAVAPSRRTVWLGAQAELVRGVWLPPCLHLRKMLSSPRRPFAGQPVSKRTVFIFFLHQAGRPSRTRALLTQRLHRPWRLPCLSEAGLGFIGSR